ncbi:MAG: hypothetical protein ACTTH8_07975 [Treponema sp.]
MPQPAVIAGPPNSASNYTEFSVDGITVYVRNGTKAEKDTLTITTTKILWVESLSVKGMAY